MASKAPDLEGDLVMRVHHLNTGTMCPIGRRLVNGPGSIFQRARMVCHCLLIETHDGLALVDTGIGLDDIANPPRLGPKWGRPTTPRPHPPPARPQRGAADDAAARSGRNRPTAGRGARLFEKRRTAPVVDASRSRSCRRHSGFSECEGARPSPRTRHGGDAPDARAEGPLHHRSVEAWSAMGVLWRR